VITTTPVTFAKYAIARLGPRSLVATLSSTIQIAACRVAAAGALAVDEEPPGTSSYEVSGRPPLKGQVFGWPFVLRLSSLSGPEGQGVHGNPGRGPLRKSHQTVRVITLAAPGRFDLKA